MEDFATYRFGEYSTRVRFFEAEDGLFQTAGLTVFDENTARLFKSLPEPHLVLPQGEESKTWQNVDRILTAALRSSLGRDSTIVGVGGGVLCDMTAFAASLYMRGCRLVLVPTTLLAMVDAALGGKTGIDYHSYKNMIGTFFPAEELRIWPGALKSLPRREVIGGLAEVIKAGILGDHKLYELLESAKDQILAMDSGVLMEVIGRSIEVKGGIVQRDFKESHERAYLNLGHTFGHALESVSGFTGWTHGEAVAWGIAKALELGQRLGATEAPYVRRVKDLLAAYGYRLSAPGVAGADLLSAMRNDKKKKAGRVRFVLQRGFQETFLQEVDDADVLAVLQEETR